MSTLKNRPLPLIMARIELFPELLTGAQARAQVPSRVSRGLMEGESNGRKQHSILLHCTAWYIVGARGRRVFKTVLRSRSLDSYLRILLCSVQLQESKTALKTSKLNDNVLYCIKEEQGEGECSRVSSCAQELRSPGVLLRIPHFRKRSR